MDSDQIDTQKDHGVKKKTPFQLQSLENFYCENNYPKKNTMEEYAAALELTYKSIRTWFIERRRKERKVNGARSSGKKRNPGNKNNQSSGSSAVNGSATNTNGIGALLAESWRTRNRDNKLAPNNDKQTDRIQVLFSKGYILKRVFRKDGPPLGAEFDPLPANAFHRDFKDDLFCRDSHRISKRRKVTELCQLDPEALHKGKVPAKKYGIGKGLMTVWRATNSDNGKPPISVGVMEHLQSKASSKETLCSVSKRLEQRPVLKQKTSKKKMQEKRKLPVGKRKVQGSMDKNQMRSHPTECKLLVEELKSQEEVNALTTLVDDEELELQELQEASNPLRCSAHLASNGRRGCPLCKDLLARFPPQVVKMKQPFCTRPWDSSPELVRKLFKAFRFLYSHCTVIGVCPFTLDEFAQAFHDKDSLLLGKIHMALLKMFLFDVERELTVGYTPRGSKNCRFLGFLHFVREQEFDIKFWGRALNPLTWTEIMRQVFIAAGFGSKNSTLRRGSFSKESNMMKYGLRPRTLKGDLFSMLSEKGSGGLKASELAKASQITALNLPNTTEELEQLICSTLSSDITLFEKIAPTAYRLRVDPHIKGREDSPSDSEDSGSVDDDLVHSSRSSSNDESDDLEELTSTMHEGRIIKYRAQHKKMALKIMESTEIDESYSGEAWVLGLMEGEYSDLSVEEKLEVLVSLVDLAGAGCSSRIEEPAGDIRARIPSILYHGSGGKVKKSSANGYLLTQGEREGSGHGAVMRHLSPVSPPDGPDFCSNASKQGCFSTGMEKNESAEESGPDTHPLRSIYLGSDRRYNSYWLFLGPCNPNDSGHRRVYFESSEDGHWEVIDTAEALRALLSVLDCRGSRESHLFATLEAKAVVLCQAMDDFISAEVIDSQRKGSNASDMDHSCGDSSSPISDIDNILAPSELTNNLPTESGAIILDLSKKGDEKKQRWDQLQAFDKWIWHSFYSSLNAVKNSKRSFMESLARCESCHDLYWRDEKHCRICHSTFEVDFDLEERYMVHVATCRETEDNNEFPKHKVLPSQLQALKAAIHAIEMSMPEVALAGVWKRSGHKIWIKRLRRTSSLPELLQVLADFVGAINEEWLYECPVALGSNIALDGIIISFQTMPQTISAVALWMVKLDILIAPHLEKLQSDSKLGRHASIKTTAPQDQIVGNWEF